MAATIRSAEGVPGLRALGAITDAVRAGAGLPEVLRAAARALDCSLVVIDSSSSVLAVAARSPADERSLMRDADDVETIELRVAEQTVGRMRLRARSGHRPDAALAELVGTLVGSEVERVRAPERASEAATASFLRDALEGHGSQGADLVARGRELGIDLGGGASVVVARAHPRAPIGEDWRARLLALVERAARAAVPGALATRATRPEAQGAEVVVLVPDADSEGAAGRRAAEIVLGEIQSGLPGFALAIGRSRAAVDPADLPRAASEALLAANVVEGDPGRSLLAFDETGTYRVLLSAMAADPAEVGRLYQDAVAPLAAYDAQYDTELVRTLQTFLDSDGNVAGTAAKLFTHRHTVRYRLERVRELCGHDVGSSEGRERLSLGLKAMRVLGIPAPRGPASERGAGAGRVPPGQGA